MDAHDSTNRPFTTYDKQIQILESRGMSFDSINKDEAKEILRRVNYYKLINGYKEFFTHEDDYSGVDFNDIYALYKFDEKLRFSFLKAILVFECEFKSITSYIFSQNFSPYSYSDISCYSFAVAHQGVITVQKMISKICKPLTDNPLKNTIKHYLIDNKENVPFWVLTGVLTFGNMVYFYKCLNPNEQRSIAKNYDMSPKDFTKSIGFLNYIRNLAAHSERLFDTSFHKNHDKLYDIVLTFRNFLHDDDRLCFIDEIVGESCNLEAVNARCYDIALSMMGCPEDYRKKLQEKIIG